MMIRLLIFLASLFLFGACASSESVSGTRAERVVSEIHDPASKKVLVASHRGDWRNYPENSLPAIRSAIEMGVDIVEIDLALTSDSVLVLCHDRTIDRTTSGRGLIAEITYDSIRRVNLRAGQNAVTHWKVPTLEEALILCKDKIVVNIDKGFQYYGLIHPLLEKYGMLEQVLIKSNVTADRAAATFSKYDDNCLFMPIVNFGKKSYRKILESYERLKYPLLAYEICWSEYTPEVETCMREVIAGGSKLWVNSLWPSLNGGLCDDAAVEGDPAEVYGKLVDMGATMIPADTLHMMAKLRIKLIAIQEEPVKVAPEMESLLRAAIALTNFEIKMVWLKVSHPAVMDCSKKVALPKSPIYLAEQFTPTDLMEIVTSMQGLGVGRCLDGSQASLDMFVESFSWMFNVRINNPNQCKHAILNRKLRLTRFLDLLRGYLIERSQQ